MFTKSQQELAKFITQSGRASSDTLAEFDRGELRWAERIDIRRVDIGGQSGTVKILDQTVNEQVGLCTIHNGKLPTGVNVVVDKVRVAFRQNGSEITPQTDSNYSTDVQDFDDALRNGNIIFKQDGNVKLKLPVFVCGSAADSDAAGGEEDAYKLQHPVVFDDKGLITWEVEYADGGTVDNTASNSHNLEVATFGISTQPRG